MDVQNFFGRPKIFLDVQTFLDVQNFFSGRPKIFWTSKKFLDVQNIFGRPKNLWTSENARKNVRNPFEDSEKTLRAVRVPRTPLAACSRAFSLDVARSHPLTKFRRPRRHFERAFSLDLAILALQLAHPRFPGTPQASIFESEKAVF